MGETSSLATRKIVRPRRRQAAEAPMDWRCSPAAASWWWHSGFDREQNLTLGEIHAEDPFLAQGRDNANVGDCRSSQGTRHSRVAAKHLRLWAGRLGSHALGRKSRGCDGTARGIGSLDSPYCRRGGHRLGPTVGALYGLFGLAMVLRDPSAMSLLRTPLHDAAHGLGRHFGRPPLR